MMKLLVLVMRCVCVSVVAQMAGCEMTQRSVSRSEARLASRPALISHFVLATLLDPSEAAALIADCDHSLRGIDGVAWYACGTQFETGRAHVSGNYDVGMYVGFHSEAAYEIYVNDPAHTALVARWGPRLKSLQIIDVLDETP